jgi:Uma2 family endonuclease
MLAPMRPARAAVPPDPSHVDQRVYLHDVSWQAYEALLAWRGEWSGLRVTYLEGVLELMSPSIDHEDQKTKLARLLEAWTDENGIRCEGVGSWTIKKKSAKRGAEPDECYIVGVPSLKGVKAPDIAIEVIWTSGGIDKLDVYRKLAVREVWIWHVDELAFHLLRGDKYVRALRSAVLPAFDPDLAKRCMAAPSQFDAVNTLRRELRSGGGAGAPKRRRRPRRG